MNTKPITKISEYKLEKEVLALHEVKKQIADLKKLERKMVASVKSQLLEKKVPVCQVGNVKAQAITETKQTVDKELFYLELEENVEIFMKCASVSITEARKVISGDSLENVSDFSESVKLDVRQVKDKKKRFDI